eukprot:Rhum_TRINITY_DN12921_c0_g1::Rhum_TRINITY_DN12921_c0_g1_i1::g.55392::m.55392
MGCCQGTAALEDNETDLIVKGSLRKGSFKGPLHSNMYTSVKDAGVDNKESILNESHLGTPLLLSGGEQAANPRARADSAAAAAAAGAATTTGSAVQTPSEMCLLPRPSLLSLGVRTCSSTSSTFSDGRGLRKTTSSYRDRKPPGLEELDPTCVHLHRRSPPAKHASSHGSKLGRPPNPTAAHLQNATHAAAAKLSRTPSL